VERPRDLLSQICGARKVRTLRGAITSICWWAGPPQLAPAKLVQFLKGRSSRMLDATFRTCGSGGPCSWVDRHRGVLLGAWRSYRVPQAIHLRIATTRPSGGSYDGPRCGCIVFERETSGIVSEIS
jgi:hypothetical protein